MVAIFGGVVLDVVHRLVEDVQAKSVGQAVLQGVRRYNLPQPEEGGSRWPTPVPTRRLRSSMSTC